MRVELYCDGACRGNQHSTNIGGWGAYLRWGEHAKKMYAACMNTTNNIMELTGAIEGLKAIKNKDIGVDVYVDSVYVYKGITEWIYTWIETGWRNAQKKPVANKELWLELLFEKKLFKDIVFHKVKGHADNQGNIMADSLANKAMDELEVSKGD